MTSSYCFYIRKEREKKDGSYSIYLLYNYESRAIYLPTGESVNYDCFDFATKESKSDRKHWKSATQRPIKKNDPDHTNKNDRLAATYSKLSNIITNLRLVENLEPTHSKVKELFQAKSEKKVKESNLINLYKEYLEYVKNNMQHGTWKSHNTAFNDIKDFLNKSKKEDTDITDVDFKFIEDFKNFLPKRSEKDNLRSATIKTRLTKFIAFLNHYKKQGYAISDTANYQRPKEDYNKVPFTQHDIERILKLDLKPYSRLDNIRDILLFGCHTALRISDVRQFNKMHIQDGFIRLKAMKTRKEINIPMPPPVEKILIKHNYKLPLISDQKLRTYLKELCKKAGIIEMNEVTHTFSGNERKKVVKPRFQLLTTHSWIKYAISNWINNHRIPIEDVVAWTGKDYNTIYKHYYIHDEKVSQKRMTEMYIQVA